MESINAFLNGLLGSIPEGGDWMAMATLAIGFVFDAVLRIWKTSKPQSLAYGAVNVVYGLSNILASGAKVLEKAARLADRVLPQRVKEVPVEQIPPANKPAP